MVKKCREFKIMGKTGLTLGKFAPLHKGHCFLIDTALSEVDELVVLIYTSSVTDIPLNIRSGWIKHLYPQVKVIECWDGPEGYSSERSFEIEQEEYIKKVTKGLSFTHFYSSESYGKHVSETLGAIDRRVDMTRQNVNISATEIRKNPFACRNYIPDYVYKDHIIKIVFVGAMSTGKSTLTEALAKKYNTTFAPEYGREYWTEHQIDRRIEIDEFNTIAKIHIEKENEALKTADKYLFVDTNAITTYMYCLDYHGHAPDYLTNIALHNSNRYDLFFLCEDDIPYDDTWDRSGPQKREVFQQQIIADLKERKIPYIPLRGNLQQRISIVDKVLTGIPPKKWTRS